MKKHILRLSAAHAILQLRHAEAVDNHGRICSEGKAELQAAGAEQEAEKYFEVEISIQQFGTASKPAKH